MAHPEFTDQNSTGFPLRFDHLSLDPSNYDLLDLDTERNSGSCNQGWARLVNHRREVALCARERQSDKRRILVNIHGCLPWIIWQMYHYKGDICTIYKCVQWIYFNHTSTTIHIRTCSVSSLLVHAWIRRHSTEQMGRRAHISLLANSAQPRPRLVTQLFDFRIDSGMFS